MAKKKVAEYWEEIFEEYSVLEKIKQDGYFKILATEIKKYKEPRLMAKFDFSKQLPPIFKNNNLGILPVSNNEYIIGEFNLFKNIPKRIWENEPISKVSLPEFIEAIDPDNIYSESNALNVALLSGMLKDAFEEEVFETVQGKMRTDNFDFEINSCDETLRTKIQVSGAQIEIDGGYEGRKQLVLIEAKKQMPEDFIIRQLYFPFRYWREKVGKLVIPVFLGYENGIYNIFIYDFEDINNYNSLELKSIKRYMLSNSETEKIKKSIFDNVEVVEEPKTIPFPQADSFTKVIGTIECINDGLNTANKIAEYFDFAPRQGKYYIDALRYLNIASNSKLCGQYELTSFGKHLISLDVKNRNKLIINEILKHKPFHEVYLQIIKNQGILPPREYMRSLISENFMDMAEETINRRASTIRGWIEWIKGAQV